MIVNLFTHILVNNYYESYSQINKFKKILISNIIQNNAYIEINNYNLNMHKPVRCNKKKITK